MPANFGDNGVFCQVRAANQVRMAFVLEGSKISTQRSNFQAVSTRLPDGSQDPSACFRFDSTQAEMGKGETLLGGLWAECLVLGTL
jgi:hypothetical protein